MKKYIYDTKKYDFANLVKEALKCKVLSEAHSSFPENVVYDKVFDIYNDNTTWYHKKVYDKFNSGWPEFMNIYRNFVKEEISKHFDSRLVYQAKPTFRVHLPENVAVGAYENNDDGFHRDSDPDYGHPKDEINVYLPLTDAYGTNTIWVETEHNKRYYSPMEAKYGEYYIWKGTELAHGNKLNDTNKTRISFDFRIIPKSSYNPDAYKSSMNTKKKFIIGDYYDEII
jgi:hypothetical protein